MQTVTVTQATYRGENVEGVFELVQGFTAFRGDVDTRRNGRKGEGFIKVMPAGEQLTRLAPNLAKPVKLTVAAEGEGYQVTMEGEPPVGTDVLAEFGVDVERELTEGLPAGVDGCGAVALFETVTPPAETAGELTDALAALRAEFEAATGRERDNLRKRLRRMEAKVAG